MNAIIYTRYSPRPEKDGDAERVAANEDAETIRLQVDVCLRYAMMKQLVVSEILKDPETSARTTPLFDREQGWRLKHLPKGTHIIASKLDRVFRETADGLITMKYFKSRNITLHFADQGGCTLDLSSGEGQFMFTILLSAAALEPARTADRTSKAMKHRQANGQRMTSKKTLPFGQMIDPENPNRTVECRSEIFKIQEAYSLQRDGMSLREIARQIGPVRGKTLSPSSVRQLIARFTDFAK